MHYYYYQVVFPEFNWCQESRGVMECGSQRFEEQVAWIQVFELGDGISSLELGQSSLTMRRGIFEEGEGK